MVREDRNLPPCMIYIVLQYLFCRNLISQQKSGSATSIISNHYLLLWMWRRGMEGAADTSVWVVNGRTSVEQFAWIRYWHEYVIGMNT